MDRHLAAFRDLVGPNPSDASLLRLLRDAGSLDLAVDRYFDGSYDLSSNASEAEPEPAPAMPSSAPQLDPPVPPLVERPVATSGWPRYIGTLNVAAFSLVRSETPLMSGTRIALEQTARAPLRFSLSGTTSPVGRLDATAARYLQPLVAEGKLLVDGAIASTHTQLTLMSSVDVSLDLRLNSSAFTDSAGAASTAAMLSAGMESASDSQLALMRLLGALDLKPRGPSESAVTGAAAAPASTESMVESATAAEGEAANATEAPAQAGCAVLSTAEEMVPECGAGGQADAAMPTVPLQPSAGPRHEPIPLCIAATGCPSIHTVSDAIGSDEADGPRAASDASPPSRCAAPAGVDAREPGALATGNEASASERFSVDPSLCAPDDDSSQSDAGELSERQSKRSLTEDPRSDLVQHPLATPVPAPAQAAAPVLAPGSVPVAESGPVQHPPATPVGERNLERIETSITAEAAAPAAHPNGAPAPDSDAASRVSAEGLLSEGTPASAEGVATANGPAAAIQSAAPSASASQLTEEQRRRVEASRQRALERKRSRDQTQEQSAMGGGESESAPKVLTEAQRAVLGEKQEAARRLRAERLLHKERKAVAARLGPLRAGFFVAARHASSSSATDRDQRAMEDGSDGAIARHKDGDNDAATLQGGAADERGGGGDAGSGGGSTSEPADVRIEECGRAQIDTVFAALSTDTTNITPLEPPPTLNATLREYQKQALSWMVERESMAAAAATHCVSAWQEYSLPDGTHFFVHSLTGCVQGD